MITFALIVFAYLVGSIPSGLWIGKGFYNTDIREHGSGNLGGTNTFRTLGVKAGLIVTAMDILKGSVATWIPLYFVDNSYHPLLFGVVAVIGHMFPLFASFRGGKAVATSAGVLLAFSPILFLMLLAVFFLSLYTTKYVSLSSMIGAVVAFIYTLFSGDWVFISFIGVLMVFVLYRHRANIKRIQKGTEPKVNWI
ncbi:glycerol-3-phosphate acyltransferase [Bacillus coahuilensis m2-6]|uniref:glycerol-3-phosphate 1-O-acyltransferase PlsY n=1 Tax=Bacillus coahuilensis TaxID=408580 RepID=UPI00075029B3|nr:glycerol-3-phosphate 1-O-acyltransferase PlsY [Bacillus coahuilensis]KUP08228.1 glycerol-3-phosphate acyltransferase [Bacillus coahuilensis m2-6]